MWGLFNYSWQNAAQASVGMQQCALGKPVNCGLQESKGDTESGTGEMADGRRGLSRERCEEGHRKEGT